MKRIVQEAEFTDEITKAAEMACEQYKKDRVCIYSGRCGTLIFPDMEVAIEAARAAAVRFDLFAYQQLGLELNLSAVENFTRDCCVTYYHTQNF